MTPATHVKPDIFDSLERVSKPAGRGDDRSPRHDPSSDITTAESQTEHTLPAADTIELVPLYKLHRPTSNSGGTPQCTRRDSNPHHMVLKTSGLTINPTSALPPPIEINLRGGWLYRL